MQAQRCRRPNEGGFAVPFGEKWQERFDGRFFRIERFGSPGGLLYFLKPCVRVR